MVEWLMSDQCCVVPNSEERTSKSERPFIGKRHQKVRPSALHHRKVAANYQYPKLERAVCWFQTSSWCCWRSIIDHRDHVMRLPRGSRTLHGPCHSSLGGAMLICSRWDVCVVSESSRTTIEERSSLIVAVGPILHPTDPHGTHDHDTRTSYAEEEELQQLVP